MVPDPVPLVVTAKLKLGGGGGAGFAVKVAITDCAFEMTTEHPLVPVHAPAHPLNVEPLAAAAVRETLSPSTTLREQVSPQSIPVGELVMVPVPDPAFDTVS